MASFFINKPLWKHVFFNAIFILTYKLNKVTTKLKNVIKSFDMTLNSKYITEKTNN